MRIEVLIEFSFILKRRGPATCTKYCERLLRFQRLKQTDQFKRRSSERRATRKKQLDLI